MNLSKLTRLRSELQRIQTTMETIEPAYYKKHRPRYSIPVQDLLELTEIAYEQLNQASEWERTSFGEVLPYHQFVYCGKRMIKVTQDAAVLMGAEKGLKQVNLLAPVMTEVTPCRAPGADHLKTRFERAAGVALDEVAYDPEAEQQAWGHIGSRLKAPADPERKIGKVVELGAGYQGWQDNQPATYAPVEPKTDDNVVLRDGKLWQLRAYSSWPEGTFYLRSLNGAPQVKGLELIPPDMGVLVYGRIGRYGAQKKADQLPPFCRVLGEEWVLCNFDKVAEGERFVLVDPKDISIYVKRETSLGNALLGGTSRSFTFADETRVYAPKKADCRD